MSLSPEESLAHIGVHDVTAEILRANGRTAPEGEIRSAAQAKFKSVRSFFAEYEPVSYAIEGIVQSSKIYTLTARTGAGKTAWLSAAALAVAMNRSEIIGRPIEQGRVLYCVFENPDDFRMRLMVAAWGFGVDLDDLNERLVIRDAKATPEELVKSVQGPFSLVIVDTFQAWFDGKDLNDNVQGGDFTRRARKLTQIVGRPSVIIAAHPRKNASDDELLPYGAGAILNEVDGNLALRKLPSGVAELHWQGKLRGLDFEPISYRFELQTSPDVRDKQGREIGLPIVRLASSELIEAREKAAVDRDAAILKAIADLPSGTVRDWSAAANISSSAVDRRLQSLASASKGKLVTQTLGKWCLTTAGKKALEGQS